MSGRTSRKGTVVAAAAVGAAALGAAPFVLSSFSTTLLTLGLIWGLLALSLNLLVTYAGLPSLGHAAPFGFGAYVVGILMTDHDVDGFFPALGIVVGACALLSLAIGLVAIRTRGVHFLLVTFAMAEMLRAVAVKWRDVTGGDDGLAGVTRPDLSPLPGDAASGRSSYFLVLAVVSVATLLLLLIVRSPFGKAVTGMRESEIRMTVLGYNANGYCLAAFVIAGTFAGVAGMLFAYHNGFVAPSELGPLTSLKALLFVVLGSRTFFGPAIAAVVVTFGEHAVSSRTDNWLLVLGIIYIVTSFVTPAAIGRAISGLWRRTPPTEPVAREVGAELAARETAATVP